MSRIRKSHCEFGFSEVDFLEVKCVYDLRCRVAEQDKCRKYLSKARGPTLQCPELNFKAMIVMSLSLLLKIRLWRSLNSSTLMHTLDLWTPFLVSYCRTSLKV